MELKTPEIKDEVLQILRMNESILEMNKMLLKIIAYPPRIYTPTAEAGGE